MTALAMPGMSSKPEGDDPPGHRGVAVAGPRIADGGPIWHIARRARELDLNSSYAYLLWCRDFADTSAVATIDGDLIGFTLGYRRPTAADTLMIWQVAVAEHHRGTGIAGTMLDVLLRRIRPAYLETTISQDNHASIRLFADLAARWDVPLTDTAFLDPSVFPDAHPAEDLFRIGPFPGT